jgi:competence protein ComEA
MRRRVAGKFLGVTFAVALLAAAISSAAKQPPEKPIDLNSATAEQLEQLPGIGPKIAEAIVAFREKSGPFRRVEELLAIRGISNRKLNAIRPYVKVGPPPSKSSLLLGGAAEISARAG